jgi:hypothetical protein
MQVLQTQRITRRSLDGHGLQELVPKLSMSEQYSAMEKEFRFIDQNILLRPKLCAMLSEIT